MTSIGTDIKKRWYFVHLVDQWLHQQMASVPMGYALVIPLWEILRTVSSIIMLWGAHALVWRELHNRFTHTTIFFHLGYAFVLVLWLMVAFYLALYFALAFVWLFFTGVAVISDVATKRNGFDIAVVVFQWLFSLLILSGSCATTYLWRLHDKVMPKVDQAPSQGCDNC